MANLIVNVKLWDKNVGALMWDKDKGVASFQYDDKFIRSGLDISPIVMPLNKSSKNQVYQFLGNRNDCFKGLPGLIADSLPDKYGTQIIKEWFTSQGLANEEITPLDQLCYIGKRGMGALEFEPDKSIKGLDKSSLLHMEELTKLADSIFKDRKSFQEKLIQQDKHILDIIKVGTSAGGAKPKAIITLNENTGEIRSGQVKAPEGFTYWLLKFDGTTYSEHDNNMKNPKGIGNIEYTYYRMAIDAGINMMESRLLTEGDSHHFMTKRYDRLDNGDKIHVQTLAALTHMNRDSRHSYEEAFASMRTLKMGYPQFEEFYRRMVFNVITRNHDDHTKNHCFLMNREGKWSLSPAYDLCYSYTPGGQWTDKHQMSLNSKIDEFTFSDLEKVGILVGINHPNQIIEKTVDIASKWKEYAKDNGVRESHIKQINENLLLLSQRKIYSISNKKEYEFQEAIKTNDFTRIIGLKDEGYIPSPKIIDELKGSAPTPMMIAVQKIFGLPSDTPGLSNIKLAQSDSKELGLNIEKGI